jgi:hypothetical protein
VSKREEQQKNEDRLSPLVGCGDVLMAELGALDTQGVASVIRTGKELLDKTGNG